MISLTALLVIIYFSSLVSSSPFILFPDEIERMRKEARETYESWINECTGKDEMPFYNRTLKNYECYPLLSQEPCEPGFPGLFWIKISQIKPSAEEPCTPEYDIDHVFYNGKCQDHHNIKICPLRQELMTNAFGEGECYCIEGFLPYIEKNESVSCYQEFLQGPCDQGQQYTFPDEDTQDFEEPVCVPTDCKSNEILYEDQCIPVPTCKDPLDYVKFENSTMVPNTMEAVKFEDSTMVPNKIEAKCGRIGFEIGTRGNLISGQVRCAEGKRKDARGRCKKGVGSKRRNKKRRQAITYGLGRNVRNVCCKG